MVMPVLYLLELEVSVRYFKNLSIGSWSFSSELPNTRLVSWRNKLANPP
jgi:hypothetical protein